MTDVTCPVNGCPGDWRYAPPGRGHTCTVPEYLMALGRVYPDPQ